MSVAGLPWWGVIVGPQQWGADFKKALLKQDIVLRQGSFILITYRSKPILPIAATPTEYEPPGFAAAECDNFTFEEEPMNIKIGDVSTVRRKRDSTTKVETFSKHLLFCNPTLQISVAHALAQPVLSYLSFLSCL